MIRSIKLVAVLFLSASLASCAAGDKDIDGEADAPDSTDAPDSDGTDTIADTSTDHPVDADVPHDVDAPDDVVHEPGSPCVGNWDCQDGLYCNGVEVCVGGFCQIGIAIDCGDEYDCTFDECSEETHECTHTPDDVACDDGLACTGTETCNDDLGCDPGTPVSCDDGVRCTLDECQEPDGSCTHVYDDVVCEDANACTTDTCHIGTDTCRNALIDADGDGVPPASCGGPDCDDTDESRHPGATEVCDDTLDSNCNGLPDESDPACCTDTNDTCACPADMTGGGLLTGTTVGMENDYCGTCGASPCAFDGADAAFYLYLRDKSLVQWNFASMTWSYYYHLHSGSCTGPEILCQNSYYYGSGDIVSQILDPGFYYLILDAADVVTAGSYNIATLVTPLNDVSGNDRCATATPISLDHAYSGSILGMNDDYSPPSSCTYYTYGGNDAVFKLHVPTAMTVELSTEGSTLDTILYLLDDTCSYDPSLPCNDNAGGSYYSYGPSRIMSYLPAGDYYVVLDEATYYYYYSYYTDYILSVRTF